MPVLKSLLMAFSCKAEEYYLVKDLKTFPHLLVCKYYHRNKLPISGLHRNIMETCSGSAAESNSAHPALTEARLLS